MSHDFQKRRVYRAEQACSWYQALREVDHVRRSVEIDSMGRPRVRETRSFASHPWRFATFSQARVFALEVLLSRFVTERYTVPRIEFRQARGRASWCRILAPAMDGSPQRRVAFNAWGCNKPVVLHELAHALAPDDEQHGRIWAGIYVSLFSHFLGEEPARELCDRFLAEFVRFHQPGATQLQLPFSVALEMAASCPLPGTSEVGYADETTSLVSPREDRSNEGDRK